MQCRHVGLRYYFIVATGKRKVILKKGEEMSSLDTLNLIYHTMQDINKSTEQHWDNIYLHNQPNDVSWTQEIPTTSLDFIHSFDLQKTAKIIDIGGGDSKLVDYLLDEGFDNITVLDISATALDKSKKRLGHKAQKVTWIVSDVAEFNPDTTFDVWHDRATFHFLTTDKQISTYIGLAKKAVTGFMTIGTFSDHGPRRCSGLPVEQYSEEKLTAELQTGFDKIRCITEDHPTPFNTTQNFLFCSFKRRLN